MTLLASEKSEVEQQVSQLSPQEQLKLIAHISEQLSIAPLGIISKAGRETLRQQRAREADELIALCDAAAEMWMDKGTIASSEWGKFENNVKKR